MGDTIVMPGSPGVTGPAAASPGAKATTAAAAPAAANSLLRPRMKTTPLFGALHSSAAIMRARGGATNP